MGYTHYVRFEKDISREDFDKVKADVVKIRENSDVPLQHGEIGEDLIALNGIGEDSAETFCLFRRTEQDFGVAEGHRKAAFNFCKTYERPYDEIASASLIALKHHCPSVSVSSDGKFTNDLWARGIELYKKATNRSDTPDQFEQ